MSAVSPNDQTVAFLPLDDATTPRTGLCCVYRDWWFAVHPERGIVLYRLRGGGSTVQGNPARAIVESVAAKLYPWAEVRQVALVFMPHRCES